MVGLKYKLNPDSCHSRGVRINNIYILNSFYFCKQSYCSIAVLGSNSRMGFLCTNDLQWSSKMVNFNLDFKVVIKTGELMVCKLKIR